MPKRANPNRSEPGVEFTTFDSRQTIPADATREDHAHWFFSFLRSDLSRLTGGEQLDMLNNLYAFVQPEILVGVETGSDGRPKLEDAVMLQGDGRAGFQRVWKGGWYELEDGIKFGIARMGDRLIRGSYVGTFADQFRLAVMETLETFWRRINLCPNCRSPFVKVGKQKYCSSKCTTRANLSAFRARHGPRDHHREYQRRVRGKLGRKVKIARRKQR